MSCNDSVSLLSPSLNSPRTQENQIVSCSLDGSSVPVEEEESLYNVELLSSGEELEDNGLSSKQQNLVRRTYILKKYSQLKTHDFSQRDL